MATKVYFIAGAEASYKEKVISDLTNMYFLQGKTCIVKYKAARIDNLELYGTLPAWGLAERVESLIYNSLNTCDALVVAGWHVNEVLPEIYGKYEDSSIIFVRSSQEDPYIKSHMVYTVGEAKSNEIIADETSHMEKFITDNSIELDWKKVSKETSVRIFNEDGTINTDPAGIVEVAVLGTVL